MPFKWVHSWSRCLLTLWALSGLERGSHDGLVTMDDFTNTHTIMDQSTTTTAEYRVNDMFGRFGAPEVLNSDHI